MCIRDSQGGDTLVGMEHTGTYSLCVDPRLPRSHSYSRMCAALACVGGRSARARCRTCCTSGARVRPPGAAPAAIVRDGGKKLATALPTASDGVSDGGGARRRRPQPAKCKIHYWGLRRHAPLSTTVQGPVAARRRAPGGPPAPRPGPAGGGVLGQGCWARRAPQPPPTPTTPSPLLDRLDD